jgi:hypothetical protein
MARAAIGAGGGSPGPPSRSPQHAVLTACKSGKTAAVRCFLPSGIAGMPEMRALAIVRELAEFTPFDPEYGYCVFCQADDHATVEQHEPSCLWRRARELYPKTVSDD